MNPSPLGSSEAILALCLALLLLAPLAIAGVALINTGLNRSRSAAQALLGNLTVISVTAIAFALLGATFCGSLPGGFRRGFRRFPAIQLLHLLLGQLRHL